MQTSHVRAYEGKDPFIFVSYAHKDAARVLPILAQLQSRGYRVWYDEGIAPGSEWPENIAQHLNDCAVTVAFVSNNSMASPNCRREITYALSKKKPFLGIFLEQAEMSPGMELQMSSQQCVMKFSYRDEEMFYDKVCSCPDLMPCRIQETAPVMTAPAAFETKTVPATPSAKGNFLKQKPWILAAAGGALVVLVLAIALIVGGNKQPPADTSGNMNVNTTAAPGTTAGTIGQTQPVTTAPKVTEPNGDETTVPETTPPEATVPEATVPETTVPEATEPDNEETTVTIFEDKVVDIHEDYLYLFDRNITAETMQQINKLTLLQDLDFTSCRFTADAVAALANNEKLKYLHIENCSGIISFDFLTSMPDLFTLRIINSGVSDSNLPALPQLNLNQLSLANNEDFTDMNKLSGLMSLGELDISGTGVSSLENCPLDMLWSINFSHTGVRDISCLSGCSYLTRVQGVCSEVCDISPLANLEDLELLAFSGCMLNSVSTPFYSLYLEELYLANCGLWDVSGLTHLSQLRIVDLSENGLSDISFIENSSATLEELEINMLPLTSETACSFLSACTELRVLNVNYLSLYNLDFCSTLTNLVELHATNCSLESIAGLKNCKKLETIHLSNNQLTDISALSGLTEDYVTLDLAYNALTDVSALGNVSYSTLCLVGNDSLDLTTVLVSGNTLIADYVPNMETNLANHFYYYGLLNCPLDQVLAIKEAFGNYSVIFLNGREEFYAMAADRGLYYN